MIHTTSPQKAHEEVVKDNFPIDPFTIYTFRHTYGTRHSQAGTEVPVLAELMDHSNVQTTMIHVHAARKQKIEATAKVRAFVEVARKAKQMQEDQDALKWKPAEDEWGNYV